MVQKDVYSERECTYNHMDRIRLQGDDSRGECTYNHMDRISLQRDDSPKQSVRPPTFTLLCFLPYVQLTCLDFPLRKLSL